MHRRVAVVDTPGFPVGMEQTSLDETLLNLTNAVQMLKPGPNIFLLVVSIERYTEDHRFMVRCLKQLPEISKFTIVAFNRLDCIEGAKSTFMEKINESEMLRELLQICSQRVVLFDNTSKDEGQVRDLFEMADMLIRKNDHKTLTENVFNRKAIDQVNAVVRKRQEEWENKIGIYSGSQTLLNTGTVGKLRCNIL